MAIVGVDSVIYGVDDLETCTTFYREFGLPLVEQNDQGTEFRLEEGSSVLLRRADDPALPANYQEGNTVRLTVWGVDSPGALEDIVNDLSRDREVKQMKDVYHCVDDLGIPIGFRVFERKEIEYAPSPHNAPGAVGRVNQHRKWFPRATPRAIYHVVYTAPDHMKGVPFYRDRLGFRISDVSKGLGIFLRADGHRVHHNLFFLEMPMVGFHHICFGVEDIDEIMVGASHMKKKGYVSPMGLGRHRIASALFYYILNPCGGEAEYGADIDFLDDHWVPREWDPGFGGFSWVTDAPPFLPGEVPWDVKILGGDEGTPAAPPIVK